MEKEKYENQIDDYLKKNFAGFLKGCPVCIGEKTVPAGSNKKKKFTRRK